MERVAEITGWINDPARFRHAIVSGRRKSFKPSQARIDIRPVLIKGERLLQVTSHDGRRDTTKKYQTLDIARIRTEDYANLRIETIDEVMDVLFAKRC